MDKDRRLFLAELAELYASKYDTGQCINLEEIASDNEITFSYGSYGTYFDGMLEYKQGQFHIFCNEDLGNYQESYRGRFTLAHELGHFFIDEHRQALESGRVKSHSSKISFLSDHIPEVEQEANLFAANLLMPNFKLKEIINQAKPGLEAILEMNQKCHTSIESAAIRYVDMELAKCVLIRCEKGKVKWSKKSQALSKFILKRDINLNAELKIDTPSYNASNHITPPLGKSFFESVTFKEYWFMDFPFRVESNLMFVEQSLSLGKEGALTLLIVDSMFYH